MQGFKFEHDGFQFREAEGVDKNFPVESPIIGWATIIKEIRNRVKSATQSEIILALITCAFATFFILTVSKCVREEKGLPRAPYAKVDEECEPLRDYTLEQLREYSGTKGKPILIALKQVVYDVSKGNGLFTQLLLSTL